MANAFTNFLGGVVSGVFGKQPIMKDFQHADRLYVKNTYARAPKLGFLYFVSFNINQAAISDQGKWASSYYKNVGMLVKRIDLPKFTIETETVNQYNRKTVIQKSMKYNPISMDFHDDNSDITRDLWKNYFHYYYADSAYANGLSRNSKLPQFSDTKFSQSDYAYGLDKKQINPFFDSIDIYVMHQQRFSQYTLVNPLVTEWAHDTLDQADGSKILSNKMSIAYETVLYNQGSISQGESISKFKAYYDTTPSPLSISGNGTKTLFGAGGIIAGASSIFGEGGTLQTNPLAAIVQLNNLAKNSGAALKNAKNEISSSAITLITNIGKEAQSTGQIVVPSTSNIIPTVGTALNITTKK